MIKLIDLNFSPRKGKRYRATIQQFNDIYTVDFGDKHSANYTIHFNYERKIKYMKRHLHFLNKTFKKIEPSILSTCILWSYPSLGKSISEFNKQLSKTGEGVKFKTDIQLYNLIHSEIKQKYSKWNARLSQLLIKIYEEKFKELYNSSNYYVNFTFDKPSRLKQWTENDWNYVNINKSRMYLPKKIIKQLSTQQKNELHKLKNKADSEGIKKIKYPSWLKKLM